MSEIIAMIGFHPGSRRGYALAWLSAAMLALAGCTTDSHVPPFARTPYEAFSRQAVVAIALREWRAFGSPIAEEPPVDKPERAEGLWQRVGEYWWLGLDAGDAAAAWTGKHDGRGRVFPPEQDETYAWSAAFVSYVMRMAGAGAGFPYAAAHDAYIHDAVQPDRQWVIAAERPERYAPRPGDLICTGRGESAALRFDDLAHTPLFKAHCDIVVATGDPSGLSVVGGNVSDAVTLRHVPVTQDGHLSPTGGWLAILRLRV